MRSKDHRELIKRMTKYVKQERWQKLPKRKGNVTSVSFTKTGNLKIILEDTTFYVLKRNKNIFQEALTIQKGDTISVALRTQLGKYYCVKLTKKKDMKLKKWL